MTSHIAFIRIKNVKNDSIDSRMPGDMPFQQFEIEETETASYTSAGYEVMEIDAYSQMIIALAPELEVYQKVLQEEQKQKDIDQKLSIRSSISESIVVAIQRYIALTLQEDVQYKFQINNYTVSMFFQIWSTNFEIALKYLSSNPVLSEEQKTDISKLISDQIKFG